MFSTRWYTASVSNDSVKPLEEADAGLRNEAPPASSRAESFKLFIDVVWLRETLGPPVEPVASSGE